MKERQDDIRRRVRDLAECGLPWLSQVGRNSVLRTMEPTSWHAHAGCIEVVYCQHGTVDYESGDKTYHLTPGKIFVSRPGERHRMMSNPHGLATYYLLFRVSPPAPASGLEKELRLLANRLRKVPRLFDGGNRVGTCFAQLLRLVSSPSGNPVERRLRALNASLSLLLAVVDAATLPPSNGVSSRIQAVADEMRANPGRAYPVEALAARVGYSTSSLQNAFKTTVGHTPHAYLLKCRIERAQELLAAGGRSVISIAEELGFPSPQHFASQFRRATGVSPTAWAAHSRRPGLASKSFS